MWHKSILDTVRQAKERGMCLYGAGFWGEVAYKVFTKLGVSPKCFCDDASDKWGKEYQGIPVYSLEDAVKQYPGAVYIVCADTIKKRDVWGRKDLERMLHRLKERNVYDSNSELRIIMYLFLLDLQNLDSLLSGCQKPDLEGSGGLVKASDLQNLFILNHMWNSGSYYFEQLFDGHPNVLSLPYSSWVFWTVYEKRLQYLEGTELLIEMAAQMVGYFHSQYEGLYSLQHYKFADWCVGEHGEFIKDVLIDADDFVKYLLVQLDGATGLKSFGHMMKVYVAAYNNCLGKRKQEGSAYWLFYHQHKPDYDVSEMDKFFDKKEFQRIENVILIREPVQHCYSWIFRGCIKENQYTGVEKDKSLLHMLMSEMGVMVQKNPEVHNVKAIRFEDLKFQPEQTMQSLCRWMEIPYLDLMLSTTLNGIQIYFPTYTEKGLVYITGNDTTAVNRKDFSAVMTLWDQVRLNMVYGKFKAAYGYGSDIPPFTEFSKETLKELFQKDFKFAAIAQKVIDEGSPEEGKYDVNEYVKSVFLEYMLNYQDDIEYYDCIKPEEN